MKVIVKVAANCAKMAAKLAACSKIAVRIAVEMVEGGCEDGCAPAAKMTVTLAAMAANKLDVRWLQICKGEAGATTNRQTRKKVLLTEQQTKPHSLQQRQLCEEAWIREEESHSALLETRGRARINSSRRRAETSVESGPAATCPAATVSTLV